MSQHYYCVIRVLLRASVVTSGAVGCKRQASPATGKHVFVLVKAVCAFGTRSPELESLADMSKENV